MTTPSRTSRILIVTPEVTYLPNGMGNVANLLSAKAGGLADVSAALISALFDQGADVHVALPDYRTIFSRGAPAHPPPLIIRELNTIRSGMPDERLHLAEDRDLFYMDHVYSNYGNENIKIALAFQQHRPACVAGSYPLQRLDDRPDSGNGKTIRHPMSFHCP